MREHTFVSVFRFTKPDRAFLAGFVAGDGSFIIRSNNAGSSWACLLDVKLRADNTPLLRQFQRWTGLGELVPSAARGNSAPQSSWRVQRRLECLELAVVLGQWPILGKAGRQFEVWRRAVELWVAHGGACDALSPLAAELRSLHHSIAPVECPVDITEPALAAFVAGFASAEAHFGVTDQGSTFFVINLARGSLPAEPLSRDLPRRSAQGRQPLSVLEGGRVVASWTSRGPQAARALVRPVPRRAGARGMSIRLGGSS